MMIHGRSYEVEVRVVIPFKGCHGLPMRPETHDHDWEAEFSVSGPLDPGTGMVCDMLELTAFFSRFVKPLDGTNLHKFPDFQHGEGLIGVTRDYPTCDTLAHYFMWKSLPPFEAEPRFQGLRISQIKVSIFEPDAAEAWGHAIIRPTSGQN